LKQISNDPGKLNELLGGIEKQYEKGMKMIDNELDKLEQRAKDEAIRLTEEQLKKVADQYLSREILNGTINGGLESLGVSNYIQIDVESEQFQKNATKAFEGAKMCAFGPGVEACIKQNIHSACTENAGISDCTAQNISELGSMMAMGAAYGAVAGPGGMVTGALAAATSYTSLKLYDAVMYQAKGIYGENNACFVEVGKTNDMQVCIGTYAQEDTLYMHTVKKQYAKEEGSFSLHVGQSKEEPFQLSVWDNNQYEIVTLKPVFYRDVVRIYFGDCSENDDHQQKRWVVMHGKGENHGTAGGKVEVHWRPLTQSSQLNDIRMGLMNK
jgi:hypothetical protein